MRSEVVAQTGGDDVELRGIGDVWDLLRERVRDLAEGFIADLPVYAIALLVFLVGLAVVRFLMRATRQALGRGTMDESLQRLALTFTRIGLLTMLTIVALSVAGVSVGAALAALGLVGLALAFAFQNILENFIAGLLILIRRPFRIGDQIIASGYEGTVADVDMRVTKLTGYDGVIQLLPNADVFRNPVVNLTELGKRRTSVTIGIDYRDDHHAAGEVIRAAVAGVEGVLAEPEPEVLLTQLGESSVDFEVRYWTAPDIRSVRHTQDRVLKAAKSAVEDAGMSIPWPIRTLEAGESVEVSARRRG